MLDPQPGAPQLAHLELGVGGIVLDQQELDRRLRHSPAYCGTLLVSTQYRPIFATVSTNESKCTGFTM